MFARIPFPPLALAFGLVSTLPGLAAEPIAIGSRPELLVDDQLIERLEGGAEFRKREQPDVDPRGRVLWQDIGYEPFMDLEFLITETRRLSVTDNK